MRDGESKTSLSVSFREYSQKAPSSFVFKIGTSERKETFEKKKNYNLFPCSKRERARALSLSLCVCNHTSSLLFFQKATTTVVKIEKRRRTG